MGYTEHSLFPRENPELAGVCFQGVLQVLKKERQRRGQDYQHELPARQRKVQEIEEAIGQLKVLYRLAVEPRK